MDAKDVRIFCEMAFYDGGHGAFGSRHVSPSGIARKVGLDEKTVRTRISLMEESGFIKYYQAAPNLALFGFRSVGAYRFEAMNIATKRRVVEHVEAAPNIVEAYDYLGPVAAVTIAGSSGEEVDRRANELVRRYELNKMSLGDHTLKAPPYRLSKLDWQIIQKLRYNARATVKEISDSISVTPRMAQYRTSRLLDAGAVLIRAVIDPRKQEGLIFYELEASVEETRQGAVLRQLRELYGEKIWSSHVTATGLLLVNLFGFGLGEPEEAVMKLLSMEGVRWSSLFILKEVIEPRRPSWVDQFVEHQVAAH
jgi:DNA-binding Lrp family transcriptional regulator